MFHVPRSVSRQIPLVLFVACTACAFVASEAAAGGQPRDMVYIPGGQFSMGTTEDEARSLAEKYSVHLTLFLTESPQRKIALKPFLIDRYPVTNAQYKEFVEATGHRPPGGWKGRDYPEEKASHPVTGVYWQDADAYARWAGLRLPTEAEWERAARGTDARTYPWGNHWRDDATRIDDPRWPQTRALTTPVGAFPAGAGPEGVMDLCGNVAEWTGTPSCPPNPERNWAWYVVKGAGAAHGERYNFRAAARNFSAHTSRAQTWIGFRCAKDAPQPVVSKATSKQPPAVPPVPPVEGPLADRYGKEPIGVTFSQGSARAFIHVPYLPDGGFSLFVPEGAGARDVPLAWSAKHEGRKWEKKADGSCAYQCTFPGKARMQVTLVPHLDSVDFTIAIENLTDKPFVGVGTNTCFNVQQSAYFEDPERDRSFVWTDDGHTCLVEMPISPSSGEPLHGGWQVAVAGQAAPKGGPLVRYPFIGIRSRDGQWVIAQAYGEGTSVATNAHYSCLHTRPRWPDIPPGQQRSMTGKLYFIRGGPEDLLKRWQTDFQKQATFGNTR